MKEVRFAAWMTSIVLADYLNIAYMWSSDSDCYITDFCVSECVAVMVGDEKAGASSSSLAVCDR
jgi:hypothetical protein